MKYWTNKTNPSRGLMPLLMLGGLILGDLDARASTLTVSSTADDGSAGTLRSQVAAAAAGDTINFSLTGTISLTNGTIAINKDLTITGAGQSSLTVSGLRNGPSHNSFSIFTISSGLVGISGVTLSNGDGTQVVSDRLGGAIYMTGGTVTVTSCTFSNNLASGGSGGAIYLSSGSLAITSSTFSKNTALIKDGGAIDMTGGSLEVTSSTFSGNSALNGQGGAINIADGSLAMTSSTLSGNSAGNGGGIGHVGGTTTITNSTLSGNTANPGGANIGIGGGILNGGGLMTIANSTISSNRSFGTAVIGGGGILNLATLTIANSTITLNNASRGGGINSASGTVNLSNSIVANNAAAAGNPDIDGAAISGDYNLVQNGSTLSGTHNLTGQDAKLGPLANNGGLTQTHALLAGSPAVDAGDPNFDPTNTPYDQRGPGFPRIKNGLVCIGAFESEQNQSGSSFIVNTLVDHDDGIAGVTDCTLREAINYAPAGATISFNVTGTITLTGGEMVITNNLTIIGPAIGPGITVSGNNASRIFSITAGTVTLSTLTLSGGNGAGSINSGNGGAIRSSGTLTVTSSTLSSNSAALNAGAIQSGGPLTVTSCTFSGNSATGTGGNGLGGAIRSSSGSLTIASSTFSGNTASTSGGGIAITAGTPSLSNTIVAGNSAPTGLDINGTVTSGDYNLVQNTAGATLPGTHNITGQPALLGPLANNGGPTQTHALLSGSPAIDAGNPGFNGTGLTDQRGQPRLSGLHVDIGAVEQAILAGSSPLLTSPTTLGTGSFQFIFTSTPGASLTVWASTDVALPFNQWSNLGAPVESPAGTFTFTDPQATNNAIRFYRVSSP